MRGLLFSVDSRSEDALVLVRLRGKATFGGFGESQLSQPSSSESKAFIFDCFSCSGIGFLLASDAEGVDDWAPGGIVYLGIGPFSLAVPDALSLDFWVSDALSGSAGENSERLLCWSFMIWTLRAVFVALESELLVASSPTVACLRSSRNVHKPSRKSPTSCFPVSKIASLGGPLIFLVRTVLVDARLMVVFARDPITMSELAILFEDLPINFTSELGFSSAEPFGDNRESVLVCLDPENTFR